MGLQHRGSPTACTERGSQCIATTFYMYNNNSVVTFYVIKTQKYLRFEFLSLVVGRGLAWIDLRAWQRDSSSVEVFVPAAGCD